MSYNILKTDNTLLTVLSDGAIDQINTDLTLIGKNSTGYGVFINDNFVHLLENFANTTQPNHPIKGQLWFDTTQNRLKVYDGTSFKVSGGTIPTATRPTNLVAGDLWIDTVNEQLYFNDGLSTVLAGPVYTKSQGVSGFEVIDILDTNEQSHTVVLLYVNQILIGVFNKDATFVPTSTAQIAGIPSTIRKGFTSSTLSDVLWDLVASSAQTLVASDNTLKTAQDFLSTSDPQILAQGVLTLTNPQPLFLGPNSDIGLSITPSGGFTIQSNTSNTNFQIKLESASNPSAIFINSNNRNIGLYNSSPQASLHIGTPGDALRPGNVIIEGNLTVNGTTTSTNTATINLADYTLTLAKTASPNDSTANGAGLIIASSTNKTFLWSRTIDSANGGLGAFTSSENIDLAAGKYFSINGSPVITATSLGASINSASGLTSIGALTSLQAASINITSATIGFVNSSVSNGTIYLAPKGSGTVDVSGARISNLQDPLSNLDAVNYETLVNIVKLRPLSISANTNIFSSAVDLANRLLANVFPYTEHNNGTICRVYSLDQVSVQTYVLLNNVWTHQGNDLFI